MRLGVLADVHGNLHALDACLAVLAEERIDAYVLAGDIVGYGPLPNECVTRVAALNGPRVAGNHDLMAIGKLPVAGVGSLASDSMHWTREQLTERSRDLLAAYRATGTIASVVVAHGDLDDPRQYVRTATDASTELAKLAVRKPDAQVLILGHTHVPLAVGERSGEMLRDRTGVVRLCADERYVLNPGSVGQSRGRRPDARLLVLDLERREARFHAVQYDVAGCRAALKRAGRPVWSCHLSPSRAARTRRRAELTARRLRRASG